MKFNVTEFIKDVGELIQSKLKLVDERLSKAETVIKDFTPYDDEAVVELMSKQEEGIKSLQDEVEEVKNKIPAPFNDEKLKESLEANSKAWSELKKGFDDLKNEVDEIPEAYDDAEIKKELLKSKETTALKITDEMRELRKLIPAAYDDTSISKDIVKVSDHVKTVQDALESLKIPAAYDDTSLMLVIKEQDKLTDSLIKTIEEIKNMQIPSIMPKAVDYAGEAIDKGIFVKHMNSLWLNLLDDNDTVPSLENKSYQQLIKAPKEVEHKGVYDPDVKYTAGDIVMFNSAGWFKTNEPDNSIPSAGWKLISKQGKQGKKGEVTIIENDTTEAMQSIYDEVQQLKGEIKRLKDASKN